MPSQVLLQLLPLLTLDQAVVRSVVAQRVVGGAYRWSQSECEAHAHLRHVRIYGHCTAVCANVAKNYPRPTFKIMRMRVISNLLYRGTAPNYSVDFVDGAYIRWHVHANPRENVHTATIFGGAWYGKERFLVISLSTKQLLKI